MKEEKTTHKKGGIITKICFVFVSSGNICLCRINKLYFIFRLFQIKIKTRKNQIK